VQDGIVGAAWVAGAKRRNGELNEFTNRKESGMVESLHQLTTEERRVEAHRVAESLYRQAPDWVIFFREILGIGGVVRRLFPGRDDLADFERTEEYAEIQLMLARLRQRSAPNQEKPEPTRVITVRMPQSLHEALQAEAHAHQTSMNKLCISKLLQVIDEQLAGGGLSLVDETSEPTIQ
jgi:predicted HicB family RNase H-like nuclease